MSANPPPRQTPGHKPKHHRHLLEELQNQPLHRHNTSRGQNPSNRSIRAKGLNTLSTAGRDIRIRGITTHSNGTPKGTRTKRILISINISNPSKPASNPSFKRMAWMGRLLRVASSASSHWEDWRRSAKISWLSSTRTTSSLLMPACHLPVPTCSGSTTSFPTFLIWNNVGRTSVELYSPMAIWTILVRSIIYCPNSAIRRCMAPN